MATLQLACPKCREHFVIDETAAVAPEGKTVVVRCTACSHSGSVVAFERVIHKEVKEAEKKEWGLAKEEMRATKAAEKAEQREREADKREIRAALKNAEKLRRDQGLQTARAEVREERLGRNAAERPFRQAESMWWFSTVLIGVVVVWVVFAVGLALESGRDAPWGSLGMSSGVIAFGIIVRCLAGIWLAVLGKGSEG